MIRIVFFTIGSLLSLQMQAQVTLNSKYEGTDLYFQNPFSDDNYNTYCIDSVFINEKKVFDYIDSSTFKVVLSDLDLHDTFQVELFHKKTCKPKLLNINLACNHIKKLAFKSVEIKQNYLFWTCTIIPKGKFQIERFDYNSWGINKEVKVSDTTKYSILLKHYSGLNKYRIKFLQENGEVVYSSAIEIISDAPCLNIQTINKQLLFSGEFDFEILNTYGNSLLKGSASAVDLSFLSNGIYYLNADNKTCRIKIKEKNIKIKLS